MRYLLDYTLFFFRLGTYSVIVVNYVGPTFMGYKGCLAAGWFSAIVTKYPTSLPQFGNIIVFFSLTTLKLCPSRNKIVRSACRILAVSKDFGTTYDDKLIALNLTKMGPPRPANERYKHLFFNAIFHSAFHAVCWEYWAFEFPNFRVTRQIAVRRSAAAAYRVLGPNPNTADY